MDLFYQETYLKQTLPEKLNGVEAGTSTQLAALFSAGSAAVLAEVLQGRLNVAGEDATPALNAAVAGSFAARGDVTAPIEVTIENRGQYVLSTDICS